jgi:hypothetical protein
MDQEPTGEELTLHFLELERVIERAEQSSTHYQVLAIDRSATGHDIGVAHRHTMALLNPLDSRHSSLPAHMAARIRKAIDRVVNAYIVLNNFGSRVEYDNSLIHRAPVPLPFNFGSISEMKPGISPHVPRATSGQPDQRAPRSTVEQRPAPVVVQPPVVQPPVAAPPSAGQPRIVQHMTSSTKPPADAAPKETIEIKYSTNRSLFTKSATDSKDGNKRRYQRLKLAIPTYVTGYDQSHGKWTEVAHTLDVSIGGVALQVAKEMPEGAVVHLTIPMPTKLRRHGYTDPTYQVYAIVRRVEPVDRDQRVIGLEFLGASPPLGYLKKPWAKFQTKF